MKVLTLYLRLLLAGRVCAAVAGVTEGTWVLGQHAHLAVEASDILAGSSIFWNKRKKNIKVNCLGILGEITE